MKRFLVAVLLLPFFSIQSLANTVTFDDLFANPPAYDDTGPFTEDGITFSAIGGAVGVRNVRGEPSVHVDDGGTGYARSYGFSMGSDFNADWFTIFSYGFKTDPFVTFPNVVAKGFIGGVMVAEQLFTFTSLTFVKVDLSGVFSGLDYFSISASYAPLGVNCYDSPCSHFEIGDVTLSPVPLPASIPLLVGALAVLGFIGRKRSASQS